MIGLLVSLTIVLAIFGVFLHTRSERHFTHPERLIDFSQFYFNMVIPTVLGIIGFIIIMEILKYPGLDLVFSDTLVFFVLIFAACISFMGSGIHIVGKILSRLIGKKHKAYRINRFYHIYVGHFTAYGGALIFFLALSMLAMNHPSGSLKQSMIAAYLAAGIIFGVFLEIIANRPREIMRFFGLAKIAIIGTYIFMVQSYTAYILSSGVSLFVTSAMVTVLVLTVKDLFFQSDVRLRINFRF